ncbi:phage protein [Streptococcus pneumoniae]|nr:phage protein [Streptococcus pneumoniae]
MNNNMLTNIALKAIQEFALENRKRTTDSMIASNFLSIQLDEQREENQRLQARVDELEALLDEQTKPADKGE